MQKKARFSYCNINFFSDNAYHYRVCCSILGITLNKQSSQNCAVS